MLIGIVILVSLILIISSMIVYIFEVIRKAFNVHTIGYSKIKKKLISIVNDEEVFMETLESMKFTNIDNVEKIDHQYEYFFNAKTDVRILSEELNPFWYFHNSYGNGWKNQVTSLMMTALNSTRKLVRHHNEVNQRMIELEKTDILQMMH